MAWFTYTLRVAWNAPGRGYVPAPDGTRSVGVHTDSSATTQVALRQNGQPVTHVRVEDGRATFEADAAICFPDFGDGPFFAASDDGPAVSDALVDVGIDRAEAEGRLLTPAAGDATYARAHWVDVSHPKYGAVGDGVADETAAVNAALADAVAGNRPLFFPKGTWRFSSTLTHNVPIIGEGRGRTTLRYIGTGTAIGSATPGVRSYNAHLEGFTLYTTTGAIGVDLDSTSTSQFARLTVQGFSGSGFWLHSPSFDGGCVYNVFSDVHAATCGTGFKVEGISSNENKWENGCRALGCTAYGFDIVDGNHNVLVGAAIEGCGTGVRVNATVTGEADRNIISFSRFEGNTVGVLVASTTVRYTSILWNDMVSTGGGFVDNGVFTTLLEMNQPRWNTKTDRVATPFRFERAVAVGSSTEAAFEVVDSYAGSGNPVSHRVRTERAGGVFYQGVRGGVTYYEVSALGDLKLGDGAFIKLGERAGDPPVPAANQVHIGARDNGAGKTQIVARFPTGAAVVIATEP